jgi:dihydrolipoamide dehydrogenase
VSVVEVRIPDIGTDEKVDVVEVFIGDGDRVEKDASLITLESEKASMDVPSPHAGRVVEVVIKVGDLVGEGDLILRLEVEEEASDQPPPDPAREEAPPPEPSGPKPQASSHESHASTPSSPPALEPSGPEGDYDTELVVIGGGPGGYTAAFRAADLGMNVTLVERYPALGGVCLIRFGEPEIDLEKLRAWKSSVVEQLTSGLAKMAKQRGVEVVQGSARFSGPHELEISTAGGSTSLSFGQAIVAAGSRVIDLPGIPTDESRVMDSTGALELPEAPGRLLVVGGGIIGLEMAMVYGALGSELTVVELLDGLIPGCDRDLVRPLERRLKKTLGAKIYLETRVTEVEVTKEQLIVRLEGEKAPERVEVDRVLVAVGRRPNGDVLGAEAAGLELSDRGFLGTDNQMRTNVPHIFAIGDITGEPMLAHKATHEGKVAAEVAAGGKGSFDARVIPSVAYTDPEIAWVGLTETDAKASGTVYESASFPWGASGRALGMGRAEGKTKLLFDPETKRILGGGVVGPGAGDLIAEIALAIEMDCEATDLALTIHPHPTLSETVAFAAEVYDGTITDLYVGKKKKRS